MWDSFHYFGWQLSRFVSSCAYETRMGNRSCHQCGGFFSTVLNFFEQRGVVLLDENKVHILSTLLHPHNFLSISEDYSRLRFKRPPCSMHEWQCLFHATMFWLGTLLVFFSLKMLFLMLSRVIQYPALWLSIFQVRLLIPGNFALPLYFLIFKHKDIICDRLVLHAKCRKHQK